MTRPLHIEVPDGIFHVVSTGIAKRDIYFDDEDREAFLRQLDACRVRFGWRCLAYNLLSNHYHLLVQTPQANLSEGMRELNGQFVTDSNRRHGITGNRFKARYWRQLVQENEYLLAAARYVALNPVRHRFVERPEDWEWSSYGDLRAGVTSDLVDPRPLLALFDCEFGEAIVRFVELVDDGSGLPRYDERKPIFGDADFIKRHAPDEPPSRPVARAAWEQARPPLMELFDSNPRDDAVKLARHEYRYTLNEIAAAVGRSPETIRRWLRMWDVGT